LNLDQPVIPRRVTPDAGGHGGELAALARRRDPCRDRAGDAMAMRIPPGAQMAQEPRPVVQRHRLPDIGGQRPEFVDHRLPATARVARPEAARPQKSQQRVHARRQLFVFRQTRR
jgi:hypothetical protein